MKKLQTTVKTGDIIIINGQNVKIGIQKRIDNKLKIALHYEINATSSYTDFVSTQQLNKLLKDNI